MEVDETAPVDGLEPSSGSGAPPTEQRAGQETSTGSMPKRGAPLPPPSTVSTEALVSWKPALESNNVIAEELRSILKETEEATFAKKLSEIAANCFAFSASRSNNSPPDLWKPVIGEGPG